MTDQLALRRHYLARETELLKEHPSALKEKFLRLAARLQQGNTKFSGLTDLKILRLILVPHFRSLHFGERIPRMLDIGACYGQMALPFLQDGWSVDLFEPDPACKARLSAFVRQFQGKARLFCLAINDTAEQSVDFHQSSVGLSGFVKSPYAETKDIISVQSARLDKISAAYDIDHVDFLKIDTEGSDFRVLLSHDFERLPPRLILIEYATNFTGQSLEQIRFYIEAMSGKGYDALIFSHDDDENFKKQIWQYRLISLHFNKIVYTKSGAAHGNIIFFRKDDVLFLTDILMLFSRFLPNN